MQADTLLIVGVNHKVAPVEVREKLAHNAGCENPVVEIKTIPGCRECCFLGTCNRVEVICSSSSPETTARAVRQHLFMGSGLSEEEIDRYSYLHVGGEAVHHLFRVAASLDSMIVGEPQILGQLKKAYRAAAEMQTVGPVLNRFINKSFSVAKRVRTETNIGSSAVSISYAAVQLAKKILGSLTDKRVMLVGAGEMAELAAEHLIAQGIAGVVVANRTLERAITLAQRFNGTAVSLDGMVAELENVDILISSTGASGLVLMREDIKPIMRQRMNRPLFLIDIAVPRDLDPKLNDLDNVYLYDIDNLKDVVEVNKSERQKEADSASRIVDEETGKFQQWLDGMDVTPTIVAIRHKADAIRLSEVEKTLGHLRDLTPKQVRAIEVLASSIVNKMLHHPITFLKAKGGSENQTQKLEMARRLFGLDLGSNEQDEDHLNE
ncbi:MAG: glutamyl-tRNA reductase [Proteobacteria bacterium]|nr:glutamyl-tRNA reductase [Desulfobulbaceae bacterium]MBU4153450.1 glutamyl-tRNA reductase [Pseudomonadota bacterium]